MDNKVGGTD